MLAGIGKQTVKVTIPPRYLHRISAFLGVDPSLPCGDPLCQIETSPGSRKPLHDLPTVPLDRWQAAWDANRNAWPNRKAPDAR